MELSRKHQRTLERIFAHPLPQNLKWREVAACLRALGIEVDEQTRAGSKVGLRHPNGSVYTLDAWHKGSRGYAGRIAGIRDWLRAQGVRP